jgi:hypothetical protein
LTINPGQHEDKNGHYCSFKTRLNGHPRAKTRLRARLTIDPGQHKDKNSYYHNFKTQLGGRPGPRFRLTIDPGQFNDKNNYYYSLKTQFEVDMRPSIVTNQVYH